MLLFILYYFFSFYSILQALLANKMLMRKWDKEMLHEVNKAEWKELETRFVSEDFINAILKFMSGNKKKENKL